MITPLLTPYYICMWVSISHVQSLREETCTHRLNFSHVAQLEAWRNEEVERKVQGEGTKVIPCVVSHITLKLMYESSHLTSILIADNWDEQCRQSTMPLVRPWTLNVHGWQGGSVNMQQNTHSHGHRSILKWMSKKKCFPHTHITSECVWVCVWVCDRERERERDEYADQT